MSLLEQDTTRKGRVDKVLPEPEKKVEFEAGDNKEYEVEAIIDSTVYGQHAKNQMSGLYSSFRGMATQKKKTLGSLHRQSYTSGN